MPNRCTVECPSLLVQHCSDIWAIDGILDRNPDHSHFSQEIGDRLRELREELDGWLEELAVRQAIHYPKSLIDKVEITP